MSRELNSFVGEAAQKYHYIPLHKKEGNVRLRGYVSINCAKFIGVKTSAFGGALRLIHVQWCGGGGSFYSIFCPMSHSRLLPPTPFYTLCVWSLCLRLCNIIRAYIMNRRRISSQFQGAEEKVSRDLVEAFRQPVTDPIC